MLWALTLAGCILGPRPDTCDVNADCRDAFGFGFTCGAEGYCEPAEVNARCAETYPKDLFTNPQKYADTVVIGTIFSSTADVVQRQSAELTVRQYEGLEEDDPDALPLALIHCDTDEDVAYDDLDVEEAAGEVARFLDGLGVPAVIGPSTSDESLAAFDAAGSMMVISPSATSPELTTVEAAPNSADPGRFWRTVPPDDLQIFAIAEDMRLRGISDVFILYEDNSYAQPLASGVETQLLSRGVTPLTMVYPGSERFEVTEVPDNAEVLFISSQSAEVGNFLDLLGSSAAFAGSVFLTDAAADPAIFDVSVQAESLFPVVRGTRPQVLVQYDPYTNFVANYTSVFPEGPPATTNGFAAYSFDAGWMVLFGLEWARANGPITGATISEGLLHLGSGEETPLNINGVQDARAAFEGGADVDVFGASGSLDFVDGEVNYPIEVWTLGASDDFVVELLCEPGGSCQPPS